MIQRHRDRVIGNRDGSSAPAIIKIADDRAWSAWAHDAMTRRRTVLIAAGPPLLGDLLRRELASDRVDVHMTPQRRWRLRRWDVALVTPPVPNVRARCVVLLPDAEFGAIVELVRRLCGRPVGLR